MDFTMRSGAASGFSDDLPWQHMLALPIASRGEVYGVLGLSSPSAKGFSSQDHRLLEMLADNVAIAVQNAMLYQQREREAVRDGLTRLYNHRFLQEKLVLEVERCAANQCKTILVPHGGGTVHKPESIYQAIKEAYK